MNDAALATARAEYQAPAEKIKSLMACYSAGIDELAKAQRICSRRSTSDRTFRPNGPRPSRPVGLARDGQARQPLEIEKLLLQADTKVNSLQAMVWRLGATGDVSVIGLIAKTQTALRNNFNLLRGEADDRDLLVVVSSLD